MDSSKNPPLADYVTKLLILEAIQCAQQENEDGLHWVQNLMFKLAVSWQEDS